MTNEPVMREIITKAICGKGQLLQQNIIDLVINTPRQIQILGNYVTNSQINNAVPISLPDNKKMVRVNGRYDVHVWYSEGQDTHSVKKTVKYTETVPLITYGTENFTNALATAEITSRPKCKKASVTSTGPQKTIKLEIEQGLSSEVIGLTKLYVKSSNFIPKNKEIISGQELVAPKQAEAIVLEYCPDLDDDFPDTYEDDDIK